jgi:co-chaperonin GroES (HSP10)
MLVPVGHRVVIKQERLEDQDPAYKNMAQLGFAIPDSDEKKREQLGYDKGRLVSVGPGAFREFNASQGLSDPWAVVGDLVAFAKYSGKNIIDPDDNEVYMVLNDEDIVCVIKETK